MFEYKLLYNMNIGWCLMKIIHMIKIDFASFVCYPPCTSLISQVVSPSPTAVNSSIRVDKESIAASASYQDNAPGVGGRVEGAHSVTAHIIVS